jgi:hypothetical protein
VQCVVGVGAEPGGEQPVGGEVGARRVSAGGGEEQVAGLAGGVVAARILRGWPRSTGRRCSDSGFAIVGRRSRHVDDLL